jgi:hypothetical protein
MPLFIDNKLLSKNDAEYLMVSKALAEIRKREDQIRIKTVRKRVLSDPDETGRQRPYPMPSAVYPLVARKVNDEGVSQEWRWCKNIPQKIHASGSYKWENENGIYLSMEHSERFLNPKTDTELIFFLINISNIEKNGYLVEDKVKESEEKSKPLGQLAALDYFLYNETSPLYNDVVKLRTIGASWGVANSERLALPLLRDGIKANVMNSQANINTTNRGISEFILDVTGNSKDEMTELRALHQRAQDKNIYGFNHRENAWCFINSSDKEFADWIVSVPATQLDDKDTFILEHLKATPKTFALVTKAVKGYDKNPKTRYAHIKEWSEFKSFCAKQGLDTKGKKRDVLEKELLLLDEKEPVL